MIKFDKVVFDFHEAGIYKEFNQEFGEGIYYINGFNGSGKTSFIRSLTNSFENYTGDILINGENILDIDLLDNNIVSCAYQNNEHMLENISVIDNIKFINPNIDISKFNEYAKKFNLNIKLKKKFKKYSGGEKQKIKLIITLLSSAEILIIDEPENNLDGSSIDIFYELLESLNSNKTIFVITHDEKEIGSVITFEDRKITTKYTPQVENTTKITKHKKSVNKKRLLRFLYIQNAFTKMLLVFLITFSVFLSLILIADFTNGLSKIAGHYTSDYASQYEETELYVLTPFYNESLPEDVKKDVLKDTKKLYFTFEDLEQIEEAEGVVDAYPVTYKDGGNTGRVEDQYSIYESINYEIPNSYFIEEEELDQLGLTSEGVGNITVTYSLYPKDYHEGFPVRVIYGEMPEDYSNEVVISTELAKQLAYDQGLNSIEALVGTTFEVSLIDIDDRCNECIYEESMEKPTETREYVISGITDIGIYEITYAYGMMPERLQVERYPWLYLEDEATYEKIYEEYVYDCETYGYDELNYEEFKTYNPDLITGFRITFETPEDLENFYNMALEKNPYLYMECAYIYETGAPSSYYSSWIKQSIIEFIVIITVIVILIFLVARVNKSANKRFIKQMRLNGYSKQVCDQIYFYDFLVIILVSLFLNTPLLLLSLENILALVFNVLLMIVITIIIYFSRGRSEK